MSARSSSSRYTAASSAGASPTRRFSASTGTNPCNSSSSRAAEYLAAHPPHEARSVRRTFPVSVSIGSWECSQTRVNVPTNCPSSAFPETATAAPIQAAAALRRGRDYAALFDRGPRFPARNRTRNIVERFWILHRGQITRILTERPSAHCAAHDLRAPRLRQRRDEQDAIGPERLPEIVAH